MTRVTARYVLALLALGTAWGVTVPLTKVAVSSGHRPLGLIVWQLLIVAAALSLVALVRRLRPVLEPRLLWYFLVIGVVGTILPNSFSYLAASQLPAGVMGIVIASVPMFSLLLGLGLRSERPSLRRALGVLLGAAAVLVLFGPETSLPDPDKAVFVLVALIAPFCYGAEGHYIARRAPASVDPVMTLLGASLLGLLLAVPLAWLTGSWVNVLRPWQDAEWALLGSSLCHAVAYTGYVWLVGAAGAVFASQIAYVVTLAAVLLSGALLGEAYSAWVWAALVLMVAGMALVQPKPTLRLLAEGEAPRERGVSAGGAE